MDEHFSSLKKFLEVFCGEFPCQHAATLQQTGASAATDDGQCSWNPADVIHMQCNVWFLEMVLCRASQGPSNPANSVNTVSHLQQRQTHHLYVKQHISEHVADTSRGDFFPAASPVGIPASATLQVSSWI